MLKAEVMVHQHPPTPPSGPAELQYGLHHLVQHNASTPFKFEHDDQAYLHAGSGSGYGTPAAVMERPHSGDPYSDARYAVSAYPEPHGQSDIGLGISMDGYGAPGPTYYHDDSQQHHGHPYAHNGAPQTRSPPTPRSTTASDVGPRSRNGNSVARTASPHVKNKVTKPKAKKAGKTDKPKTPKLTAPLSVLTKDFAKIPVKNMEEWVNRPASVRRTEVEKRKGYVTRPMNSFMLYRSAYAERTKQWCLQNNHQVVSSVSGESWPLEPPEIREQYNEYAKIERINHQNAHPDYKFSPSKASTAARKRKGMYSDEEPEEEPSDLDDDADWAPSRRNKQRSTRRSANMSHYVDHNFGRNHGLNRSSWEATNEGRPMPGMMGNEMHHYYQTTVHPSMAGSNVEDLRMQRMENPPVRQHYPSPMGQSLLGLPGGQHHELLQMSYHEQQPPMSQESQVDPMLLAYDGVEYATHDGHPGEAVQYETSYPDEYNNAGYVGDAVPQHQHPDWQVDSTLMPMENGLEFDKWMD